MAAPDITVRLSSVGEYEFTLTEPSGSGANLTGRTVTFRAQPVRPGGGASFEKDVTVTTPASGEVTLSLDGDDYGAAPLLGYGEYRVVFVTDLGVEYPQGAPKTMRVVPSVV